MLFFACQNVHTAFYTLFHHFAGYFIWLIHITFEIIIIRRTAAAANKLCKAIVAVVSGEKAGRSKLVPYVFIQLAVEYVAH